LTGEMSDDMGETLLTALLLLLLLLFLAED